MNMKTQLATYILNEEEVISAVSNGVTHLICDNSYFSNQSLNPETDPHKVVDLLQFCNKNFPNCTLSVNLDIVLHESHIENMRTLLKLLSSSPVHEIRIQDLGMIALVQEYCPDKEICFLGHNAYNNSESFQLCHDLGVSSFQFNNELPHLEIERIIRNCPYQFGIQVHGHILIQHSNRRLLFDKNKQLSLKHIKSEDRSFKNRYYTFFDSNHGCFMYNHFERCLIEKIESLKELQLSQWIIDLRNYSKEYKEASFKIYKKLLTENVSETSQKKYLDTLQACTEKPLKLGFFHVNQTDSDWRDEKQHKTKKKIIIGTIISVIKHDNIVIELKDSINSNKHYAIQTPEGKCIQIKLNNFHTLTNETITGETGAQYVLLNWIKGCSPGSLLIES